MKYLFANILEESCRLGCNEQYDLTIAFVREDLGITKKVKQVLAAKGMNQPGNFDEILQAKVKFVKFLKEKYHSEH